MSEPWPDLGARVSRRGNRFTQWFGRTVFRAMGWRLIGQFPDRPKLIVAVAPHSSNIDFVLAAAVIWGYRLNARFLAKHTLFRFPLGSIIRLFGGIPVDRRSAQGLVGQMTEQFDASEGLILGITPEGTRSRVREWRKGFAQIAAAAQVPVVPTIVNYTTREVRFADVIDDVADPEQILARVQAEAAKGVARAAGPG